MHIQIFAVFLSSALLTSFAKKQQILRIRQIQVPLDPTEPIVMKANKGLNKICQTNDGVIDTECCKTPPDLVFLQGTVNQEMKNLFKAMNVTYYEGQNIRPEEKQKAAEQKAAKRKAAVLLFIIDEKTMGISSMAEAVKFVSVKGRNVVVALRNVTVQEPKRRKGFSEVVYRQLKDVNVARSSLHDAILHGEATSFVFTYDIDGQEYIQKAVKRAGNWAKDLSCSSQNVMEKNKLQKEAAEVDPDNDRVSSDTEVKMSKNYASARTFLSEAMSKNYASARALRTEAMAAGQAAEEAEKTLEEQTEQANTLENDAEKKTKEAEEAKENVEKETENELAKKKQASDEAALHARSKRTEAIEARQSAEAAEEALKDRKEKAKKLETEANTAEEKAKKILIAKTKKEDEIKIQQETNEYFARRRQENVDSSRQDEEND